MQEVKSLLESRKNIKDELDCYDMQIEGIRDQNLIELIKMSIKAMFGEIPGVKIEGNQLVCHDVTWVNEDDREVECYKIELIDIQKIEIEKNSIHVTIGQYHKKAFIEIDMNGAGFVD